MRQPETLQTLIDRLNAFTVSEIEFKDIQIKSAELVKQVFPNDSAQVIYKINTIGLGGEDLFTKKAELRSILEAKLESIIRAEQARITVERNAQLKLKQFEEQTVKLKASVDTETIKALKEDLNKANSLLNEINGRESQHIAEIDSLQGKLKVRLRNNRIKDTGFWSIVVAICALFLFVGYYWGNSRFDSEKFQLRDQRDNYKRQVDSLKRISKQPRQNKGISPQQ